MPVRITFVAFMPKQHPLFIAFEGIDGSGKSTQARLLTDYWRALNYPVHLTFEPSNQRIGALVRTIIQGRHKADPRTLAALFAADRLDHLLDEEVGMLKHLAEGTHVITDRYYFSSYAYHSLAMDMDWIIELNRQSAAIRRPDLTVFIDVEPAVSMERIRAGRQALDLFETEDQLQKVKALYDEAFQRMAGSEKIVRIDGNGSPETVEILVRNALQPLLPPLH